ncbi:MAG: exodeoxyribonuclease III, partial [Myxococcota bacterium]
SWNGVAVLLRKDADELAADEAEVTQIGLPGQDEMGARLLTVAVADLSFTTIYAPNGKTLDHPDVQRKLAWYDALIAHLARSHQADQQMIVCGDFNITPAALDSWSEPAQGDVIFHTEAERSRMRALLDWGLRDVYRAAHPDEPGFTWWDYRGGSFHKGQGLRIDLLLATAGVAERSRGVHLERTWRKKIDGMTPSDHAPVWVDIAPA